MSRGGWRFAAAGVVAALTVTATVADAQAERVRWKMHSAYATNIAVLGEAPGVVSETVEKLSDGQFRIKVFEPGALVPGIQYYDAVSAGSIDSAYGTPGFDVGKNFAYAFFASVPFGPGAGEYLAWMRYGGGLEMAREKPRRDHLERNGHS